MGLSQSDYEWAAKELSCDVATVKAIEEVESKGKGFLPNGNPVILFEAHIFSKLTNHKYDKTHPDISSRVWNRRLYATGNNYIDRGMKELQRLEKASSLDRDAALQSASWGKFQIMGMNWKISGYSSLQAFINAMYRDERSQLEAFVGFCKGRKLDKYLKNKDFDAFAAGYNGPSYKANKYDEKIESAYSRYSKS